LNTQAKHALREFKFVPKDVTWVYF
jgi:hypothetical protein